MNNWFNGTKLFYSNAIRRVCGFACVCICIQNDKNNSNWFSFNLAYSLSPVLFRSISFGSLIKFAVSFRGIFQFAIADIALECPIGCEWLYFGIFLTTPIVLYSFAKNNIQNSAETSRWLKKQLAIKSCMRFLRRLSICITPSRLATIQQMVPNFRWVWCLLRIIQNLTSNMQFAQIIGENQEMHRLVRGCDTLGEHRQSLQCQWIVQGTGNQWSQVFAVAVFFGAIELEIMQRSASAHRRSRGYLL